MRIVTRHQNLPAQDLWQFARRRLPRDQLSRPEILCGTLSARANNGARYKPVSLGGFALRGSIHLA